MQLNTTNLIAGAEHELSTMEPSSLMLGSLQSEYPSKLLLLASSTASNASDQVGNDFRVPINQGMEAFQAAKIKGLKTKFLYYPNEGHWVLQPQNGLLWHSEFFKWLDQTVKNRQ